MNRILRRVLGRRDQELSTRIVIHQYRKENLQGEKLERIM